MSIETHAVGALDYQPCHYGSSRLVFRGPAHELAGRYCAVLGGNETYGRFVERPYPALIEAATGLGMVNLGCMNAGLDVYLNDSGVLEICGGARVAVLQLTGAQNMTNRFYAVHPRRNDRFLRASPQMRAIYPEVDFTDFNFTRHMLLSLQQLSAERFDLVVEELKAAWVARMKTLLGRLPSPVVLLWAADRAPGPAAAPQLDRDPLLIDQEMIAEVRGAASDYVECVSSPAAKAKGTAGMVFSEFDSSMAAELPGPAVHAEIAEALAPVLQRLL
ncbi:DUF6473 family protein [Acidimangrovimonas pyrenivorans]|uniref:DUF6473 family protein n=1 Tax=Acidimangrovimonas pyrenivorans TaxID=2030798 RepID=A0ABV7AK51_9RHOB